MLSSLVFKSESVALSPMFSITETTLPPSTIAPCLGIPFLISAFFSSTVGSADVSASGCVGAFIEL